MWVGVGLLAVRRGKALPLDRLLHKCWCTCIFPTGGRTAALPRSCAACRILDRKWCPRANPSGGGYVLISSDPHILRFVVVVVGVIVVIVSMIQVPAHMRFKKKKKRCSMT